MMTVDEFIFIEICMFMMILVISFDGWIDGKRRKKR